MRRILLVVVLTVAVLSPLPAQATFPGANGDLAYAVVVGTGDAARGEIRMVGTDGSRPRVVRGGTQPAWDPAGRRLAFVRYLNDVPQVFVMPADGSWARQITKFQHGAEKPAWSPDGTQLVFVRYENIVRTPLVTSIWRIKIDGTDLERVVPPYTESGRQTYAWDPAWGVHGRIAYSANAATNADPDTAIFTVRADGSGRRRLTPPQSVHEPDWSPDGRRLAYKRNHGINPTTLHVMRADGSGRRTVVRDGSWVHDPTWSPDGRRLAYTDAGGAGRELGLYTVRQDGTGHRFVRAGPIYDVAWQPRP
jgi:Tol biopolymer transport system component